MNAFCSTNDATSGQPHVKINLDTDLTSSNKMDLKWIIDFSVKHKTIKYLEDNIGENLHDLWFNTEFLRYNTKSMICERKKNR